MLKKLLVTLPVLALLLTGCDKAEREQLQAQNDSLRVELESSKKAEAALFEVGALMDSIDVSRQLLKAGMVEGTSYDDYTTRMKSITEYIAETKAKVADLESEMNASGVKNKQLSSLVSSYKKKLDESVKEVNFLKDQVEKYKTENSELVQVVELKDHMILDQEEQILVKQQELALIEARVQEIMIQSKMSEADAYYARASAVEEAANRTKLAPKKKKETLREALELYKKSLSMGKEEAQAKITDLEGRL